GDRLLNGALCPMLNLVPGAAVTSLVARLGVSPFGKLNLSTPPALAVPFVPFVSLSLLKEAAMTPRRQKKLRQPRSLEPLHVTHAHAAGIDVHAAVHWVAVPPGDAPPPAPDHPTHLPAHVRSFGACTADLVQLADWLAQCGVKTVAMESTGIYWIPLFELLESRGFEVYLVDPRQSRHAPGRPKSDVLDCQWLQRLHSYGLL